ncbi:MAG TPA: ABC transporter ATP-binding protein [Methylomirabilota bacterium]|nr:ABC transporter ATP-binding protein [Methylomirabilota bacterium]
MAADPPPGPGTVAPGLPGGGAVPATPGLPEGGAVPATPGLVVRDLRAGYRDVPVLRGVSLAVGPGEIVALVGANGAGKTTTLRAIAGLLAPAAGEIHFDGARIDGLPSHEVVARGIVLTPEGRKIFPSLTVRENLDLGGYLPAARTRRRASLERVMALFPILAQRQRQPAGTLSGGEQQMLAIARSLMAQPRLLMLDEPSLGLAPLLVERIFEVIRAINGEGTPVLLVEQNVHRALALAARAYVLEQGQVVLAGPASGLAAREDVRRAYLGL